MEDMTFLELCKLYSKTLKTVKEIELDIKKCWDIEDKSKAKMLECCSDEHYDILTEIEEILNARS